MKASYLHLKFGLPPGEANNEAPRPEIHSNYSAAEAPHHPCLAPPATPPPPGASPPPRGRWQLPCATEFGLGQPMRQRHVSLNVEKESQPKFTRRSPNAEAPAMDALHVHLRIGLEKPLDYLRAAIARCVVQGGPASVRSPSCGRMAAARMHHIECASGHLPLQSSVPSCWSRCLLQSLFHSLHV